METENLDGVVNYHQEQEILRLRSVIERINKQASKPNVSTFARAYACLVVIRGIIAETSVNSDNEDTGK